MLKQRRFAGHWKLLIILIAVVAVGLAIAPPASMASTHRIADPIPARLDQAEHRIFGTAMHATADPGTGRPTAPGTGRRAAPGTGRRAAPGTGRRAAPGTGCLVSYTSTSWPSAFRAEVTITNRGRTSIHGWTLTFRFPGDEAISGAWNAAFTQTGAEVSVRNLSWDATIPRGASQSFGFMGAWQFNDTAPTSFSVNGMPCS
jgi:cellulase/cellobiase CelA1